MYTASKAKLTFTSFHFHHPSVTKASSGNDSLFSVAVKHNHKHKISLSLSSKHTNLACHCISFSSSLIYSFRQLLENLMVYKSTNLFTFLLNEEVLNRIAWWMWLNISLTSNSIKIFVLHIINNTFESYYVLTKEYAK